MDTKSGIGIDMLTLNNPPLTQHISIPRDLSQLSCEAFSAGIVEGVLDGLDMVRPLLVSVNTFTKKMG